MLCIKELKDKSQDEGDGKDRISTVKSAFGAEKEAELKGLTVEVDKEQQDDDNSGQTKRAKVNHEETMELSREASDEENSRKQLKDNLEVKGDKHDPVILVDDDSESESAVITERQANGEDPILVFPFPLDEAGVASVTKDLKELGGWDPKKNDGNTTRVAFAGERKWHEWQSFIYENNMWRIEPEQWLSDEFIDLFLSW